MTPPMEASSEALMIVLLRTDQPNAQRRLNTILAAMEPVGEQLNAEVFAFDLGHTEPAPHALTANAYEHLRELFGQETLDRLQLGSLTISARDLKAVDDA